ncbi:hypothetical protein ABPG75_011103 [Micractinium tetrahymenae]
MAAVFAAALPTCYRPAGLPAKRRAARPGRRAAPVRAFAAPPELLQLAADTAAPGTVDAPISAIVIGAVVVTALSFAVTLGLKPGTDAAIEMQKRDSKKFNKYDK